MCARVDYFVDGQPFVSVVVDGEDREDWLARTTNPRILVQSCQVCRDSGAGPAAAPARVAPHGRRRASCRRRRRRPRAADCRCSGVSRRRRARAVYAAPSRSSSRSRRRALSRARESSRPNRAMSSTPRRSRPSLAAATPPMQTARRSRSPSASSSRRRARRKRRPPRRRGGPLNRCVREDAVYNYGEMVDVGLINACAEPLVVFGCAQGTGKDRRPLDLQRLGATRRHSRAIGRSTPRPPLYGRRRRRHSHVHVPRQLLRDARAELAAVVGRLRGAGRRVPLRWPALDARPSAAKMRASTRKRAARSRSRAPTRLSLLSPLDAQHRLRAHVRGPRVRRRHVERVELGLQCEARREADTRLRA